MPCFDAFYGTAVEVAAPPLRAALAAGRTPEVLDLGAGTGLLSLLLSAAVPGVRLTLVDAAPAMLAVATDQLARPGRVARGRPGRPGRPAAAPAGTTRWSPRSPSTTCPTPASGRSTAGSRRRSSPAGCSSTPSRWPVRRPLSTGGTTRSGPARITELGSDAEEIAAARERMRHDRPATVADQCGWLVEAGLVDVDCFFKEWRFAVFGGRAA